ncbi:MAG: DUF3021 domain-containing protein [Acholeplasmataceae bacterium]|jgi:Ca2+/Na+ antiporter
MNKKFKIAFILIFGFLAGIGIGHIITIIVSAAITGNSYHVVVPDFLEMMGGNEVLAATIAALVTGLLGLVFTFADIIWKKNEWSLLKRTIIFYFVTVIPTILAGTFLRWFKFNIVSLLIFIGIFTVIFVIIWVIIYLLIRKEIKTINAKLSEKQKN